MKKFLLIVAFSLLSRPVFSVEPAWPQKTHYKQVEILGQRMFYREAGKSHKITILLLHGYPSSSHTYRELIPLLSGRYHVIAPDNIGSGYSSKPDPKEFDYTFDTLSRHVESLLIKLKIERCVLYMQDFGAPIGFRLMLRNPERIEAVIAQNANAYLEGIPPKKQAFFRAAQLDKSSENVARLYEFTSPQAVKDKQYLRDVSDRVEIMSPDSWIHDSHFLSIEAERNIQVKLFQDYKTNLDAYPVWQDFLRRKQIPLLIPWGKNDPVFTANGARAYLKDSPKAELHLLDTGHFAVEEKAVDIAKLVIGFLGYEGASGSIIRQISSPASTRGAEQDDAPKP